MTTTCCPMNTRFIVLLVCAAFWFSTVNAQKPEIFVQTGHTNSIYSIAFSPDNKLMASGSRDATIRLWDFAAGRELRVIHGDSGWISVAFSPDGKTIAGAHSDQRI